MKHFKQNMVKYKKHNENLQLIKTSEAHEGDEK